MVIVTRTAAQLVDELDTLHVPGDEITVSDADGKIYTQETCACGTGLGHHLSMEAHREQVLERYVLERITEAAGNNHSEILIRVVAQLGHLDQEIALFDAVPMHIHATLCQIGMEAALDAGLPYDQA